MAMSISIRITTLLREKEMSQRELARITGITESAVSHYIKGDRIPRGNNLVKIANALNTTIDDLLNHSNEHNMGYEFEDIKTLIARNVNKMSQDERVELVKILI